MSFSVCNKGKRWKFLSKNKIKFLIKFVKKAKEDETMNECFDDYGVDINEIDFYPMCFADLDVSARTMHGIIYFNSKLLEDPDPVKKILEYGIHENNKI